LSTNIKFIYGRGSEKSKENFENLYFFSWQFQRLAYVQKDDSSQVGLDAKKWQLYEGDRVSVTIGSVRVDSL